MKLKQRCDRFNKGMNNLDMSAEQRLYGSRFCGTFEEFCLTEGYVYEEGATLTRIERQIGGDRFPDELRIFGDLRKAHLYNPFTSLRIIPSGPISCFTQPPIGVSIRDWLAVSGLKTLIHDLGGVQQACSFVHKFGNGNGRRVLDSLFDLMPSERLPITEAEVFESYARSTELQLGSSIKTAVY
jgi:hypothetical protein